jgi:hypothetical protein
MPASGQESAYVPEWAAGLRKGIQMDHTSVFTPINGESKAIKYPACYGSELPKAINAMREWIAGAEYAASIAVALPSTAGVIAAVSKISDG